MSDFTISDEKGVFWGLPITDPIRNSIKSDKNTIFTTSTYSVAIIYDFYILVKWMYWSKYQPKLLHKNSKCIYRV